ncbi:MAG: hypothetical protein HN396_16330 [Gemmatimonadales bacterium]|jgi:hypothetical protein|nr:hypothetical protein [Gemmatimonadales bacterium]
MADPIREFQADRIKLLTFIEQNQRLFDKFFDLADQYNGSLVEAKQHVRDHEPDGPVTLGPFRRSKSNPTVTYVPGLVPASVLGMPGVVKSIDTAALEVLVRAGAVNESEVEGARMEKAKTPSVSGPKEVVVKL